VGKEKEHKDELMPTVMEITAERTRVSFMSPIVSDRKIKKEMKAFIKTEGATAITVYQKEGDTPHFEWEADWDHEETTCRPLAANVFHSDN
jgi:hypothetical protein